jgi:hypothetical protein
VWICLALLTSVLAWWRAVIRTDPLVEAVVGYALCLAAMVLAMWLPGRWRPVGILLAGAGASFVPLWINRGLFGSIPPDDLWIGQSMTLVVLFPLAMGVAGAVGHLRGLRERPQPSGPHGPAR